MDLDMDAQSKLGGVDGFSHSSGERVGVFLSSFGWYYVYLNTLQLGFSTVHFSLMDP